MPDLAELTRQYQIALEYERRAFAAFDNLVAEPDELAEATEALEDARVAMESAYWGL